MKERLVAPDFIKGICIILMVYGHVTHIGSLMAYQNRITDIIYTFHMPLFLIISGYFFSFSKGINLLLKNLFQKIAIPYILFISLYLIGLITVAKIGIPTNNTPPDDFLDFVTTVFLQPSGGYWFLHSLILINLVLYIVYKIAGEKSVLLFYLFSSILFIVLDLADLVKIRTSIYFILGYVLQQLTLRKINIPSYSSLLLFPIYIFFLTQNSIYTFSPIEVVNCFIIMTIFWSISTHFRNSWLVNISAWIGQNTLIILLLHALFIIVMKPFKTLFLNIDSSGVVYSLAATIFTVIMCMISSRLLDTLKISRYLFNTDKLYKSFKSS